MSGGDAAAPRAPVAAGDTARLFTSHDWNGSALGAPEAWPASLRAVRDLILASRFPMFAAWGPDLVLLYNDAYADILGAKHPAAFGARFDEVWREIWPDIEPLVASALAGHATYRADMPLTMNRRGYDEQTWFTFSYSPITDDAGRVAGMFCACTETTATVLAEQRQAFQLRLDEAIRRLSLPREIMETAVRILGEALGADRVGYGQVRSDGESVVFESCYAAGLPPLLGEYPLDGFGAGLVAGLGAGLTESCDDVLADPGQSAWISTALGTRAYVAAPLVRGGRLRTTLYVNFREPHRWRPDEIELAELVAARTWDAVERARAEAAVRESEMRFRTLADLSPDAILISQDDALVYANAAALRLHGVEDPSELVGKSPLHFIAARHHERIRDRARRLWAGETAPPLALEIVRSDGERLITEISAALISWDGRPAIEVLLRDISRRRMAEAALRESEARFRNVAEHAPMMMWVTDADGRCSYLNSRWYAFTGQAPSEALGFGWLDAIHPDDRPAVSSAFREANSARQPWRMEYRLRRRDGAWRWVDDSAAPRFDDGGRFLGYVGSVVDVQEDWEAKEKIRESEERLRALMDAMPAFVWLATPDGKMSYFNDLWYDFTGQTPDESLPDGWVAALHPDDVPRADAAWEASRRAGADFQIEMRYRSRDGAYRWHVVRAKPVRDASGAVTTWLGVSFDTHELRLAAEHQALLINELNHRVKNTLATVQAMAAQMVRGERTPEEAHEAFTGRLLALSAAHNVLTEQRWAGADLRDVVSGAVETFGENRGRFQISGPSVWLPAKTALAIAMALHELGTNAIKYGALSVPEGRVALGWTASAGDDAIRLGLEWREMGGPMVSAPVRRGFGSRLLERGLAAELGGPVRLAFHPEGLVCTLEAAIPGAGSVVAAWQPPPASG
ncbi:MAG: PAS domain S-box protein [Phenylobacterium sp.]|nr:PAS domain S-box protein [Phenylobacterium sp.]